MMAESFTIRLGAPADAPVIAELMRQAGAGLYEHMLEGVVPGLGTEQLLEVAINEDSSVYSYANALVIEQAGSVAGLILGYAAEKYELPHAARQVIPDGRLSALSGILNSRLAGSYYVNSLAVRPAFARRGLAKLLLDTAARLAREEGFRTLSLHVWTDNQPAMQLYAGLGFEIRELIEIEAGSHFRFRGPVALVAADIDALLMRTGSSG